MSGEPATRIVVICPNPSLDRTVRLGRLRPGAVNRAGVAEARAGGKGVNVARVLRQLGHRPVLLGPLGGDTGATVSALAAADGLDARWTDADRPIRICTALIDEDGVVTEVNEPGRVSAAAWYELLAAAAPLIPGAVCVISGSMPEVDGVAEPVTTLLDAVAGAASVWLDSSGPALVTALDHAAPPTVVKVNLHEATAALAVPAATAARHDRVRTGRDGGGFGDAPARGGHDGRRTGHDPSPTGEGAEASAEHASPTGEGAEASAEHGGGVGDTAGVGACLALAGRTGGRAVVTLGADGVVAGDGGRLVRGRLAPPPGFRPVNPTGCGDSLLAGLVSGLVGGLPWTGAVGRGLAAAVSNLGRPTAGSVGRDEVTAFEELARVAEIRPSPCP